MTNAADRASRLAAMQARHDASTEAAYRELQDLRDAHTRLQQAADGVLEALGDD